MATRQQQRRGTSEQWSTANPILAAGEIGYETDTNEFRIGDGVNRWNDLSPFKNLDDLGGTLDDYIPLTQKAMAGGVATLTENGTIPLNQLPDAAGLDIEISDAVANATQDLTDAINGVSDNITDHEALSTSVHGIADTAELATKTYTNDQISDAVSQAISDHSADTTNVHGIANTANLATQSYVNSAISTEEGNRNTAIGSAVSDHSADTTSVHGIADTSALATKSYADGAVSTEVTNRNTAISTHNSATTSVHGISDTAALATKVYADNAVSTHESDTTSVHGIADTSALATKSYADNAVSTHEQDTTNIHGIADTSALATKAYADNAASTAVAAVIDAAPAALDTLNELAAALGDNENYATTVTNALALKAPLASPTFTGTVSGVTKSMVGLGNADNTADADKPVSSATQTALDLKADIASPTFTGTVSGITKAMVGLSNVNNTADANKPVSSATQSALNDKLDSTTAATTYAPKADPTFTGTVTLPTGTVTSAMILDGTIVNGDISSSAAIAQSKISGLSTSLGLKADLDGPTFTGTVSGITKSMVGLGSVDNTADTAKPVSTAQQTALDLKANLASPALTGVPTAPTAISSTNTTQVATTAYVKSVVSDLTNGAGAAYDTLKELQDLIVADESAASTLTTLVGTKAPLASPTFTGTVSGITKSMVGLESVDNTADTAKPISTATQTALDLKLASATAASTYAPIASPTFTGTVNGITKSMVGLANVDNTADASKPVSTATQTALDLKANLVSPTFTGTVSGITKSMVGLGSVDNTADTAKPVSTATQTALDLKANLAGPTFTGTVSGITKSMVGLGSVDNTADSAKPVSTATQTALDAKAPLASPALTGIPTAPTASAATNTTQVATTAYVRGEISALVNSATSTLDTLGEIATALGNDANLSTTLTNSIALKAPLASPTFTGTVTVAASGVAFTDGTQSKEGVPSRTPIIQKTASYTLSALTERDSMIEVSSATGVTLTIPTNATLALPIGTSIDILQTSTGQVTIAGAAGVTVNATPGLKLRTQWSGATLFKRATDTWVVYGDLSA
jgi:hypothetical protein